MTDIAFHVNLADPLGYACRLLRKACASGARVVVTGPREDLAALDAALWTFSAQDFLPHGLLEALPEAACERTPIVLAAAPLQAAHRQVLVNLGAQAPEGFEQFERLIELVSGDDEALNQARVRWKQYAARGHTPHKFDRKDAA